MSSFDRARDTREVLEDVEAIRFGGSINAGIEEVAVEVIAVGDCVFLARPIGCSGGRFVMAKSARANGRTDRIVGWLLDVGGELAWLGRGARLWRRRPHSA